MTTSVLSYEMIKVLRKRRGLSKTDGTEDKQILKMQPKEIIMECLNYYLGDAGQTKRVLESRHQGVISIFNARGTTFEGRKEKLLKLLEEDRELECDAYLIHEPNNPYDPNAISIRTVKLDIHVGYAPREICVVLLYGFAEKIFSQYDHKLVIKKDFNEEGEEIVWVEFYLQETFERTK